MPAFWTSCALLLLALGVAANIYNWACALASYRLRRNGSQRHISTVPIVPQIAIGLAVFSSAQSGTSLLPTLPLLAIALMEPSVLYLLHAALLMLREKLDFRV